MDTKHSTDHGFPTLRVGLWPAELARIERQVKLRGIDLCAYCGTAIMERVRQDEATEAQEATRSEVTK